jgi:hypothetical protein
MQTSCIQHPANDRFLTIHRWQLEFCNGNQCAAALLSFFESCHNEQLHAGKDLLQRHTIEQLVQAILIFKRDSILAALKLLVARNAIELQKNPNPRLQLEKHFRFKPHVINAWLAESAGAAAGGV